jgi:hypothetical protein
VLLKYFVLYRRAGQEEAVVAIHETNDFFGEGCLAGQTLRIATVAAMMDSVIVRLEKAAIVRVILQEPAFSGMFMAHLLAQSIRVEADLVDQLFNSSEKRLARLLLLMANFGKDSCGRSHPTPWRFASLVGTDAFAGALRRGSIGTIRETIKIENTQRYREVLWLGDLDSNHRNVADSHTLGNNTPETRLPG